MGKLFLRVTFIATQKQYRNKIVEAEGVGMRPCGDFQICAEAAYHSRLIWRISRPYHARRLIVTIAGENMRRRYIVLLLCVGVFLAWRITSWYVVAQSPFSQALAKGRHQWSMHQPMNYKVHVAFISMESREYWITVRNGIIIDAKCVGDTPEYCLSGSYTIPKLFNITEDMYKQSQWADAQPVQINFKFDPIYGFPESMVYSSKSTRISDFWSGMRVTEFEVLP